MNLKYLFGSLISIPLLPIMYFQGKQILQSVPKLPEAKGIEGKIQINADLKISAIKVIAIGESTIAGVGVETHREGFTGTFANEISKLFKQNVDWKVYARNGYTAKRAAYKIVPKITEQQADLIVVGLGGNDAFTLNRPSKWKHEIGLLIVSLQSKFPEAKIIFLGMPPIKEFPAFTSLIKFTVGNLVEILGEALQEKVAEYENVYYFGEKITIKGWMEKYGIKGEMKDFFSDGVHPSKLTYQTWAEDAANKVFNNKKIRHALQE